MTCALIPSGSKVHRVLAMAAVLVAMATAAWAQPASTGPSNTPTTASKPSTVITAHEVSVVEAMLSEQPQGVGRPITDRATWEALGATKPYQAFVAEAEKLLKTPLPDVPDDLYLEFSRNGNRSRWQNAELLRRNRIKPLVLAECIENKGRFLPAIEELIAVLCAEKSWMLPASDKDLSTFNGGNNFVELWASAMAWDLATIDSVLGDKLVPATRQNIRQNIRRRIFDPYHQTMAGTSKHNWWATAQLNWNPVCLAGVTGAAMQQIASRHERAEFVAAAINYSQNYLKGYPQDAYCTEGVGYWCYGFGHYALLTETIRQATGGKIDLADRPLVSEIARYGVKMQIMNGVWPAFADCPVKIKPEYNSMYYANQRWHLGLSQYSQSGADGHLFEAMLYASWLPTQAPSRQASATTSPASPLRDWFDKAGILIARPAAGSSCRIGVALKGGNNDEFHNHNDIGSYVVVAGKTAVLLDPGGERYTARTFGPHRYDSNVLNSYGHAVPVIAGKLQSEGAKSRANILKAEFSDQADVLEMDIRSAYPKADIDSLVRTFVYSRQGAGTLSVTDQVKLPSPQTFGTALILAHDGACTQMADGSLVVQKGDDALKVTIATGGEPFKINVETLKEDMSDNPTRIGVNLINPVSAAKVTVKIEPTTAVPQSQPSSRP